MFLVDTHTHLYAEEFDADREQIVQQANAKGIQRFYLPNIDSGSIEVLKQLLQKYPDQCYGMMGLHPCSVKANYKEELRIIKAELDAGDYCAVGEIGMDLYWDKTFVEEQKIAFATQMEWAIERGQPISIHCRNAFDEIYELLRKYCSPSVTNPLGGIFHCFSGNEKQAEQILELGFYLGIGGVLTFKNAGLDKVVKSLALDKLVLETDSPYLAPVPHRGKRNESEYLYLIAAKVAELKACSMEEVAAITTANANKIFSHSIG